MSASRMPHARVSSPTVLGRYRLVRRLGAGAFGTVWMARDERLERDVAIKILARDRILGGRFQREARAAARLLHPGIVTLYEAAVDDDGAYLVSELVRGTTLASLLATGALSDRDIVSIAITLCDALAHAHEQGIVHRDLKPSNVLIPEQPASPAARAKLTDFGVARVIGGESLTRTGEVIGTAAYMAPEQAEGLEAGAPADLYALALVAYEGLTGVNPLDSWPRAHRPRRLGAHLPPLRRQRRELPRELGRAIDLALRPRASERGTIAELREALVRSLPAMNGTAGVVAGPWPASALTAVRSLGGPASPPGAPTAVRSPGGPTEDPDDADEADAPTAPSPTPWLGRALGTAAAALSAGWLTAHVLAASPGTPVVTALLAALAVAALPRIGWAGVVAAGAIACLVQGRPGAALLVFLAGAIPMALAPGSGVLWALPAGAVGLGLAGLAGAWPALAARARAAWSRAALGAAGWIWLLLAAPIHRASLYLSRPSAPGAWSGSLQATMEHVLGPIVTSGVLAGALVWAAAAAVLPWILRGRRPAVDIVLGVVWAAVLARATTAAIALVHPGPPPPTAPSAAAGAVAAGLIALGPTLASTVRTARARARLA